MERHIAQRQETWSYAGWNVITSAGSTSHTSYTEIKCAMKQTGGRGVHMGMKCLNEKRKRLI